MEANLPVQGDGATHYYHQGPVFEGDKWDPEETANLKDKGAVMGAAFSRSSGASGLVASMMSRQFPPAYIVFGSGMELVSPAAALTSNRT
jgi:hypothetical protein